MSVHPPQPLLKDQLAEAEVEAELKDQLTEVEA